MKRLSLFRFAPFVLLFSVCFSACSSSNDDYDNGGDNGFPTKSGKLLSKWSANLSDGQWYVLSFKYDSLYRVSKINFSFSVGSQYNYTESFTYTDTLIYYTYIMDNDTIQPHRSYKLALLNDLIIWKNDTNIDSYSYDQNGYIKLKSHYGTYKQNHHIWSEGNLTKIENDNKSEITNFEYTDIAWPKNFIFNPNGDHMWGPLSPLGYWGKTPKNLPKRQILMKRKSGELVVAEDTKYEYTIIDGHPVRFVATTYTPEDTTTSNVILEWY